MEKRFHYDSFDDRVYYDARDEGVKENVYYGFFDSLKESFHDVRSEGEKKDLLIKNAIDILNMKGFMLCDEDLIELSNIKSTKGKNALMEAVLGGNKVALEKLLRPIIKVEDITETVEPKGVMEQYINSDRKVYKYDVNDRRTITTEKKSNKILYDVFEKDDSGRNVFELATISKNYPCLDLLCDFVHDYSQDSDNDMELMRYLIERGEIDNFFKILESTSAMDIYDPFLYLTLTEKNLTIESLSMLMDKLNNNSICSQVIALNDNKKVDNFYKIFLQKEMMKRGVDLTNCPYNFLERVNNNIIKNESKDDSQIEGYDCHQYAKILNNIYDFSYVVPSDIVGLPSKIEYIKKEPTSDIDVIYHFIDKPINVIESYFKKNIKEVIDGEDIKLDSITTERLLSNMKFIGDNDRLYKLAKAGIKELDFSNIKDYESIFTSESIYWLGLSEMNVVGYDENFINYYANCYNNQNLDSRDPRQKMFLAKLRDNLYKQKNEQKKDENSDKVVVPQGQSKRL